MNLYKILLFACFVVVAATKELPDFVKPLRCNRKDSKPKLEKCLIEAINTLKPHLLEGVPDMGVPVIDPLHIPTLQIDTGETPSFKFVADLKDVHFMGAKDMVCTKAVMDIEKGTLDFSLKLPKVWITGDYKANGKVLVIQFNGGGAMSMNLTDVVINGVLHGKAITRKGKEYYQFDKIDMDMDVHGTFALNFENLLPDPTINARTNEVINENAADLYKDLKPTIGKAVGDQFGTVFNDVHRRFSNDLLYLE